MANRYHLLVTNQFIIGTAKIIEILVVPWSRWLLGAIMTLSSFAFIIAPSYAAVILGNATVGSLVDSGDSNYLNGSKISVGPTSLTVTSMSVFVGSVDAAPNNQYRVAIYTDLNGFPGTLVVSSTAGSLTPNAWNTLLLAATLQANTSYWLMYNTNGRTAAVNNLYYTNGSQGQGAYSTSAVPFGSWPGTFGAATLTTAVYSLYVTANSSSDSIPPTVSLTAPSPNAQVSGVVNISADATDNVGIASVQFQVDGVNIGGEVTAYPYTSSWNTALTPNGNRTLTAVAKDTAGNQTTSSPIVVTVSNTDVRSSVGEWSSVLNWPLIAIHASLLKNSKVLVFDHEYTTTQPMLWDPTAQTFTNTPLVNNEIFCSGHTPLADGRIVVAGGHKSDTGEDGINTVYLYDPDTNTWARKSDMAYARWYPAVTKLSDGRAYILSGQITTGNYANIPEIYNPANGTVTAVPTISTTQLHEEEYPANFHLPNGMLLAISPQNGPVQLLDPIVSTWTNVNTTPVTFGSAVQYRPGKILMSGGGASFLSPSMSRTALLDMNAASPTWRQTAAMSFSRYMHNLVMLPTGEVLAVGGSNTVDGRATDGPLPVEKWDPNTESWTTLAALQLPRMYHSTAMLLPDGRVLAAGGGHAFGPPPDLFSAQVYSPPYFFKGPRPQITSAPGAVPYGSSSFTIGSPNASNITSVVLIALASVTHSTDMNQFYTELQFSKISNQLSVAAPQNGNQVAPGYYMLFIVDANGVPSVAKILQIGSSSVPPGDTTPPSVVISSPPSGTTYTSAQTVTLTATASDNVGVSKVEFYDGGVLKGTDTASPYTYAWAFTSSDNGTHSWTAKAYDAAGNTATSTAVSLTVNITTGTVLGLSSIGSTLDDGDSNFLNGSKVTTSTGGTVVSMSVYVGSIDSSSTNRQYQLAIYTHNPTTGKPGTLVATATSGTLTANSWNTLPITATLNPTTSYWLIYNTNGRTLPVNNMYFNNGAIGQGVYSTNKVNFGTWPTPFPASTLSTGVFSLYATFGP